MKIGDKLLKELKKIYQPGSMIHTTFGRYDIALKTDDDGNAVMLFIGKADNEGKIKGNRFSRVQVKNSEGKIIKDHWDHKGKV